MKLVTSILGSILFTLSGLANAGVIYKWYPTNDVAPRGISLLLEFDTATVKSGSFEMQIDQENLEVYYPPSGLMSLSYNPGTEVGAGIYWDFRKGTTLPGPVKLDMRVSFKPGNHLTGYIYAHNFDSQFGMSTGIGNGPNFTVFEAESDAGMNGCGWTTRDTIPCFGATGQIRQVPEPSSTLLLGLAGLGLLAARRKVTSL